MLFRVAESTLLSRPKTGGSALTHAERNQLQKIASEIEREFGG